MDRRKQLSHWTKASRNRTDGQLWPGDTPQQNVLTHVCKCALTHSHTYIHTVSTSRPVPGRASLSKISNKTAPKLVQHHQMLVKVFFVIFLSAPPGVYSPNNLNGSLRCREDKLVVQHLLSSIPGCSSAPTSILGLTPGWKATSPVM